MPFLDLSPDFKPFYLIDDYTDPWTQPETVLFVHGFTENTEAWRAWVPHFSRRYRMIRFDLRGFGQSGPVAADFTYSLDLFVDDLVRVVNRLSKQPVHVVAGKSGGVLGVKLAAMRPDLVTTLTLACTPPKPPKTDGWIEHMMQHGMRSWARSTMRARLGEKMPQRGIDWWVDMMGGTAVSTAQAYLRWVGGADVTADLANVRCPTLVITTGVPERAKLGELFKHGIPGAEMAVLPVDGYHAAGSDPDICARATLDFIARHASSSRRNFLEELQV